MTSNWLSQVVRRVDIEGDSMVPTLIAGQRVTAVRRWRPLRVGDLVLVADPRDQCRSLVKRCWSLDEGGVELRGDNSEHSTDSRTFGQVARRDIHWLIVESSTRP